MDLQEYTRKQQEAAKTFRSQIPTVKQEQENVMKQRSRQDLAGSLAGVKQEMSGRGLLYSGLRGAAETDAASQAASQLAAQRANLNQRLEGQAQDMEKNAIAAGMERQKQEQAKLDAEYEAKQSAFQRRQDMMSGLFKAGGSLIGGSMGSGKGSANP